MKIKQLYGEDSACDFKESVEHKQPKSWLKSISAFANGMGGTLVFGVDIQVYTAHVGTDWTKMTHPILANTKGIF